MSMGNELVAKRYAVALFELIREKGIIAQAEKEIELVQTLFNQGELRDFFSHPKITIEQKKTLLEEHLKDKVSKEILNALFLMLDRKRGDSIAEMAKQFLTLAMEEQNIAEAVVYTAAPLNEEQQQAISDIIAKKVGKEKLRMQHAIQPDLIGGVRIRVGNQIFDGSVSGKLESLKRELAAAHA